MFPSGKIAAENSKFSENAAVREHRREKVLRETKSARAGTSGHADFGRERERRQPGLVTAVVETVSGLNEDWVTSPSPAPARELRA